MKEEEKLHWEKKKKKEEEEEAGKLALPLLCRRCCSLPGVNLLCRPLLPFAPTTITAAPTVILLQRLPELLLYPLPRPEHLAREVEGAVLVVGLEEMVVPPQQLLARRERLDPEDLLGLLEAHLRRGFRGGGGRAAACVALLCRICF